MTAEMLYWHAEYFGNTVLLVARCEADDQGWQLAARSARPKERDKLKLTYLW